MVAATPTTIAFPGIVETLLMADPIQTAFAKNLKLKFWRLKKRLYLTIVIQLRRNKILLLGLVVFIEGCKSCHHKDVISLSIWLSRQRNRNRKLEFGASVHLLKQYYVSTVFKRNWYLVESLKLVGISFKLTVQDIKRLRVFSNFHDWYSFNIEIAWCMWKTM